MWGLGASAFFIEYIIRVSPACMVPDLMQFFRASSLEVSSFAAYFLYIYVGMQIPVGILVDRFGTKVCLGFSTALCAFAAGIFATTDYLWLAQLARLLMGFGASFALVSTLKLAMGWFEPRLFSILVGITQALGMTGGAAGAGLMGRLVEAFGWQQSILFFASILGILAVLILAVVRDTPKPVQTAPTKAPSTPLWQGLKIVFRNQQTWLIALYAGLLYMPMAVFAELWGSFYLTTTHNLSNFQANDGISIIFLGWAMGAPLAGILANRLGRRAVMILSALAGLILLPLILYLSTLPIWTIYSLLFLFGLSNTGAVPAYTAIAEINPPIVTGIALGFGNGMSVVVGAFCQQWIGALIDWLRNQREALDVLDYTPAELKLAMSILIIGTIITLIMSLFIKETLKKN